MIVARKSIPEPNRTASAFARNMGVIFGVSTLVLGAWTWLAFFAASDFEAERHAAYGGCPYGDAPAGLVTTSEEEKAFLGLWNWVPELPEGHPPAPDDLIRFYYFHDDGIGLYRYGRQGFNNTHSFDWQRKGDELWLKFRKTGATHDISFRLEKNGEELVLQNDPRQMGSARYRRGRGPVAEQLDFWPAQAMEQLGELPQENPTLSGNMWIEVEAYETGGMAFSMYQFAPAALDGRGVGWHHRGDFDNWSTESLEYRVEKSRLHLKFERSQETHKTPFWIAKKEHAQLELHSDPRNWWQRSAFVLMGRSFAAADARTESP